jgi:hypothetical protein
MRVTVLCDYEFERIREPLLEHCDHVTVFANRPADPAARTDPRIVWRHEPLRGLEPEHLLADRPDVVLPRVRGTENEDAIYDYARWFHDAPCGRNSVHSPDFAESAVDKAVLYETATRLGIRVPPTRLCHTPGDVVAAARETGGFPVVLKLRRAASTTGTHLIRAAAQIPELAAGEWHAGVVVQRMLGGIEFGLEVVSSPHGAWRFPTACLGRAGSDVKPLARRRFAPFDLPEPALRQLDGILDRIVRHLGPRGPWQTDMLIADGLVYLLEINARLGGLSNLSRFSTGTDPHTLSCLAALGSVPAPPRRHGFTMELPVPVGTRISGRVGDVELLTLPARTLPHWRVLAAGPTAAAVTGALRGLSREALEPRFSALAGEPLDTIDAIYQYT